jgi:hypothetical protein
MPFSRIAENRIREALEEGRFDDLPGAGRRLDLEEYFSTPEDLRMAYSILKSANCAPPEVELANDIARLDRELARSHDPTARKALQRARTDRQTQLAVLLEQRARRRS